MSFLVFLGFCIASHADSSGFFGCFHVVFILLFPHLCELKILQHGSSNDFRSANFIEIFIDGLMAKEEWKPLDSLNSIWSLFADWGSSKDGIRERYFRGGNRLCF